jgi:hypothetical protein
MKSLAEAEVAVAERDGTEHEAIRSGDAVPCTNPACKAPGWPLAGKPRNWPWADRCWNCDVELR